jgi:hypothetical protein
VAVVGKLDIVPLVPKVPLNVIASLVLIALATVVSTYFLLVASVSAAGISGNPVIVELLNIISLLCYTSTPLKVTASLKVTVPVTVPPLVLDNASFATAAIPVA